MSWKLLLIGGGLGLMGCVEQTGFADPPLVPSQIRSEATMPPAFGISTIAVRAFVTEAGATREVTGATCELTSPYSTASFTAPATVSVPDLGNQTPVVRVRCAEGGRSGGAGPSGFSVGLRPTVRFNVGRATGHSTCRLPSIATSSVYFAPTSWPGTRTIGKHRMVLPQALSCGCSSILPRHACRQ